MSRTMRAAAAAMLVLVPACSLLGGDTTADPSTELDEPVPDLTEPTDTAAVASASAPNIVVFMTDDQTVAQMSVLAEVNERITARGKTFTQSVVNLPSCCPSRATFLTGQHAGNHGVLTNAGFSGGFGAFEDQETTMPAALQAGGYRTVFVGKYLNGFGLTTRVRYTPPGWHDFRGLVAPTEVLYHSPAFWENGTLVTHGEDTYAIDAMTSSAVDALDDSRGSDRPFFLTVSYPAPHAQAGAALGAFNLLELQREADIISDSSFLQPPQPARRHRGEFADVGVPRSPSVNEFDVSDKPSFLYRRLRTADDFRSVDAFYQAALESLLAVDESVAVVMSHIEARADGRDTWFIFTSDNGLMLGEHRHFGVKYFPYEEAVRVPLVISGPGVDPGSETPALASNIDLAPTILDIAGTPPLRDPDGISLLPILHDEVEPTGRAVLLHGFNFRAGSPPYRGVHTGDSVYIEWAGGSRELYDLTTDPLQLENLADRPDAATLRQRNEVLLRRLEDCAGAQCHGIGVDLPPPSHPTAPDRAGQ